MTKNLKYFFGALVISLPFWWGFNVVQGNFNKFLTAQISAPFLNTNLPATSTNARAPLTIDAKAALSVEVDPSGKQTVQFSQNSQTPLPIASLTKLMTASVIFDNRGTYDFSKAVTISKTAADQENSFYGNLTAGENYTIGELVKLMLVFSSNDAAYSLAEVKGVNTFVADMNYKAAELGMSYTHYVNPNGLDPQDASSTPPLDLKKFNYSTASDLAKLSEYIIKNQPAILRQTTDDLNYNDVIKDGVPSLNLSAGDKLIGGKTGFTDAAGGCLLYIFQDGKGDTFVNVILGATDDQTRIVEMQKLIDWLGT